MANSKLFGNRIPKIPHLVATGKGGVAGEVADVRADVEATFKDLETYGLPYLEEYTNLAAADTDAFLTTFATAASLQTILRAAFTGVQTTEMVPPRNPTITSSTHAHVTGVTVTFTGRVRDVTGQLVDQTDTIAVTNGGGATDAAVKAFAFIDEISIPAMGGASGTLTVGFGVKVGLAKKVKVAAGLPVVLQQITAGALVTNGTFVAPATASPHGTWSPNTAANGTNDYALVYVRDDA